MEIAKKLENNEIEGYERIIKDRNKQNRTSPATRTINGINGDTRKEIVNITKQYEQHE